MTVVIYYNVDSMGACAPFPVQVKFCKGTGESMREAKQRILIADDSAMNRAILTEMLGDGYDILEAENGLQAVSVMQSDENIDLLLLDIMMPVMDGMQVCREIRKTSSVPIIMLTAKGAVGDKVAGLDIGADDYVTKPFEVKELLARIHAVMRRSETDNTPKEKKLCYDKLIVNLDSYELIVDGVKVDTPPKEMELLYHLAASPNIVFTRNQLLDEVWGFDYFGDSRTVDVHIKRLREKLEGVSPQWSLQTVWGVGYKFEVVK